jgi:hypothetical protein
MRRRTFITFVGGAAAWPFSDRSASALLRVIIFGLGLLLLLNAGLVRRVNQNTLDRATTIANERPQARLP